MFMRLMIVLMAFSLTLPALAQQDDPDAEAEFVTLFNQMLREEFETRALAVNPILNNIADEIADSLACSDERVEFDIQQDAEFSGFNLYEGDNTVRTTRVPLLPVVNAQPIEDMIAIYGEGIYEANIAATGTRYREMGVGVVPCFTDDGGSTPQYGLFVIFGSQPNRIPVVIENGGDSIAAPELPLSVTLSIHEENTRRIDGIFGQGDSMRLSDEPITDETPSQDFEAFLDWELTKCDENTVYYELTDTEGIVVSGETTVQVDCEE